MNITSFAPNIDGTALVLVLTDATNADVLTLWTGDTYKDYGEAIDISGLLNGTASQTILITSEILGVNAPSGIYSIEVESNIELNTGLTGVYTKYEECILNKLVELKLCDDCLNNESLSLTNSQTLLTGLKYAVNQGFIEEAKTIKTALDKYCSNACKTCGKYPYIIDNNYYDFNI
jgi:hypothetical protein